MNKIGKITESISIDIIQLSDILGVSKELLYMIRDGKREISKKLAHSLEEKFGIPYSWSRENTGEFEYNKMLANKNLQQINDRKLTVPSIKQEGIPMYNHPATASGVEIYQDGDSEKIIGYLSFPGLNKGAYALPVYGHSMYPTLENGSWTVLRPIEDSQSIVWGEVYYIEWGDYRMYKRLLASEKEDEVILWSDNQDDKIGNRPKFSPIHIKKDQIRKLSLLTDIYKKANH